MSLLNGEQEMGQGIIGQQNNNERSELDIHLGNITSLENLANDITDYDEEASDKDDEEVVYSRLNMEQEKLRRQKEFDEEMGKLKRLADRIYLEKIDVNSDQEKLRHKPVITMLEDIRESLMERMHKKRDFIANKDVSNCPRIQERLERSKFGARGWLAFWDGKFCFGVREGATQTKQVVNLPEKTCSCNAWQLSGVPCNHVVAAIWKKGHHPEDYVADCYRKATYLKAYAHCLEPLNSPQEWPQTQKDPISPPPVKKLKACRLTTKRRKQVGEVVNKNRMSRSGNEIWCSRWGGSGHNIRKCPSSNESSSSEILKNQQHEVIAPTKMHNKGMGSLYH